MFNAHCPVNAMFHLKLHTIISYENLTFLVEKRCSLRRYAYRGSFSNVASSCRVPDRFPVYPWNE